MLKITIKMLFFSDLPFFCHFNFLAHFFLSYSLEAKVMNRNFVNYWFSSY